VTRRLTTWIGSPAAAWPVVRSCSRAKAAASASTSVAPGQSPDRDRQLERLPLVLQIDASVRRHRLAVSLRAEKRLRLALERAERGGNAVGGFRREGTEDAPDQMVLALGLEEPDRAEHAGRGRHQHGPDGEGARHLRGEERPVAAEGDQDEVARVAPALDGHRPDRAAIRAQPTR
jgi:hypothetical protein